MGTGKQGEGGLKKVVSGKKKNNPWISGAAQKKKWGVAASAQKKCRKQEISTTPKEGRTGINNKGWQSRRKGQKETRAKRRGGTRVEQGTGYVKISNVNTMQIFRYRMETTFYKC